MLKLHADVERLATWRRRCAGVIIALSFGMAYNLTWPSIEGAPATRALLVAWLGAVCGWLLSAVAEGSREQRLDLGQRQTARQHDPRQPQ